MANISALQTFRAMDVDRTGSVTLKEFTNGLGLATAALRMATAESDAKTVFARMDADKNGKLSNTELAGGMSLLATDTAGALLAMQEKQSDVSRLLTGLKVGMYASLSNFNDNSSTTAYNVLMAYLRA